MMMRNMRKKFVQMSSKISLAITPWGCHVKACSLFKTKKLPRKTRMKKSTTSNTFAIMIRLPVSENRFQGWFGQFLAYNTLLHFRPLIPIGYFYVKIKFSRLLCKGAACRGGYFIVGKGAAG